MITPDYLTKIVEATEEKVNELNTSLTKRIVNRILKLYENTGKIEVIPSSLYDAMKQVEAGRLLDDVVNDVAKHMPMIEDEVKKAFYESADEISSGLTEFTKKVGAKLGMNVDIPKIVVKIPKTTKELSLTDREINMLESAYRRTKGEISNITKTLPSKIQSEYIDACDRAYFKVSHGVSPDSAIADAIDEIATQGIKTVHYSTRTDRVEVAIARAVRTGINIANGDINLTRCASLGCNYVIVSQHIGARVTGRCDYTDHSFWQGKVYSLNWNDSKLTKYAPNEKSDKENDKKGFGFLKVIRKKLANFKYRNCKDFIDSCGYGNILGICGINCRHTFDPFFPEYGDKPFKQIDQDVNKKRYELEQNQRAKERKIRETKRRIECFSDRDITESEKMKLQILKDMLKNQYKEYKKFCIDNNLSVSSNRLKIAQSV